MTINPARIGTSEAELRRVYVAAQARLYSAGKANEIANKLVEERQNVHAANDRLMREIAALEKDIGELEEKQRTRGQLEIKKALARKALDGENVDPVMIIEAVAGKHRLPVNVLLSPSRMRTVTDARLELYYELATRTRLSYPQIGAVTFRDHTSVFSGINKYCERTGAPHPRNPKP